MNVRVAALRLHVPPTRLPFVRPSKVEYQVIENRVKAGRTRGRHCKPNENSRPRWWKKNDHDGDNNTNNFWLECRSTPWWNEECRRASSAFPLETFSSNMLQKKKRKTEDESGALKGRPASARRGCGCGSAAPRVRGSAGPWAPSAASGAGSPRTGRRTIDATTTATTRSITVPHDVRLG